MRRLVVSAVMLLVVMSPLTGFDLSGEAPASGASGSASAEGFPRAVGRTSDAGRLLRSLKVEREVRYGYDRDLFNHWVDADADDCDTRREVLIAEAVSPPEVGEKCFLTGGSWVSAYDGTAVEGYPSSFDIDHMVPLAEAWDSGARNWDAELREAYANDLEYEGALIAVTAVSNRAKSDSDPTDWLPRSAAVCGYVADWVRVKYRWGLSVDRSERRTLRELIAGCDPRSTLT